MQLAFEVLMTSKGPQRVRAAGSRLLTDQAGPALPGMSRAGSRTYKAAVTTRGRARCVPERTVNHGQYKLVAAGVQDRYRYRLHRSAACSALITP